MTAQCCPRETDLSIAIAAGRWPETADADLRAHVAGCASCRDLAVVAVALARDAQDLHHAAAPPSSAIVWWRAQMRARHEAARAVDRPITAVHGIAVACAAGLFSALAGSVASALRQSTGWFDAFTAPATTVATLVATLDVTSRWVLYPAAAIVLSLIVAPVAIYAILQDE